MEDNTDRVTNFKWMQVQTEHFDIYYDQERAAWCLAWPTTLKSVGGSGEPIQFSCAGTDALFLLFQPQQIRGIEHRQN